VIGETRVDMGNLYRVLRALEEDGLVSSEWQADAPGPAKRIYELTPEGRRLLDEWATALRHSRQRIGIFLERYEGRRPCITDTDDAAAASAIVGTTARTSSSGWSRISATSSRSSRTSRISFSGSRPERRLDRQSLKACKSLPQRGSDRKVWPLAEG